MMLKYLLSLFSLFVLLFTSVLFPAPTAACPVKLPETLLSLYRNSDAVYVARFDKVEDHEIIENTDRRTVLKIKKHFDILSALKGEPRKIFALDEQEYRYKPDDEDAKGETDGIDEVEEIDEESVIGSRNLKSGDLLLLFLKKGEDGKTLELTDYRDAIKKMSPQRLESYEARIRELNSIFSGKTVDNAAIVEWLVRCAQDPATRWEGAYQLQRSFQLLEWKEDEKEREKESGEEEASTESEAINETQATIESDATDGATDAGTEGENELVGDESEADESVYAQLLSNAQKESLMRILTERPARSAEVEEDKLSSGDKVLINLVSNWGDNRFARFLFDRLQGAGDEPYFVNELMSTISKILEDDELSDIASRYDDAYYQDGDEEVESEDATESEKSNEVDSSRPVTASPLVAAKDEASGNAVEPVKKVTYKELRAELSTKFLERGFIAIQIADAKQAERASR